MLKNIQTNFKLKNLIAIFLTPILLLGFLVGTARAETANHVVISEIQIAGVTADDEFIELYNPTVQDINLTGYNLKKKTKTGTESALIASSYFQDIVINPHGYLLLTHKELYQGSVMPSIEWPKSYSISSSNTVILYNDSGVIDKVGWGESVDFETAVFSENPPAGQSLERKANAESTVETMSIGGVDEYLGNGWESDNGGNNSADFILKVVPNPQNSQSAAEPAIENSQAPTPTPIPAPNLSPAPSSSPISSVLPVQSNLPVAEAGADKEAVLGESLDFDGSDSFDSAGKKISFAWDFGDKTSAKGENAAHVYKAIGEYTVVLKVDNGESVGEDSLKVKIIAPEFSEKIILSEILPNPIGVDSAGEWIEIFNSGDKKVNLKGWILTSGAKDNGKQYVFSGDKFIEAKSYLIIKRSASGLVLTNESGRVSLLWPPDKIMSETTYGVAKEGKSYAFLNNAWQWVDVPTPGKENSAKVLAIAATPISKAKEKITPIVNSAKDINVSEVYAEEKILNEEEVSTGGSAVSPLAKNTGLQLADNNFNAEDFLDKLIAEKVDKAILKVKAAEVSPQEKVLALADNIGGNEASTLDKETVCRDYCVENGKNIADSQKDVRKNPWFYGNLILSALSLFLVWRYQEIRKKAKNYI